jgi:L-lactate utilization protein LutC
MYQHMIAEERKNVTSHLRGAPRRNQVTAIVDKQIEVMPVNRTFASVPDRQTVDRTADALRGRHYEVHVVDTGDQARDLALSLIPEGSEVGQGASETLDQIGFTEALDEERYIAIRPRTRKMDRATQSREIRKLSAAPDVQVNSVHAVTEYGQIVIASKSGSQLGPIVSGAGKVILVVGSQKIVRDLDTGFRRVREYNVPLEDAKMQRTYGIHSEVNKMLVLEGDVPPGRTTVILVREAVGV